MSAAEWGSADGQVGLAMFSEVGASLDFWREEDLGSRALALEVVGWARTGWARTG